MAIFAKSSLATPPIETGFSNFLLLRWLAAGAQLLLGAYCILNLRLALPWSMLAVVSGYLLATNLLLWTLRDRFSVLAGTLVPSLLFLDTLMLTLMLYVSGGLQNPFLVLYILHIVISALILPSGLTGLLLVFTAGAMGVLSFSPYPPYSLDTLRAGINTNLHVRGILLAQLGVAAGIGWFVYRLRRELERSRARLDHQEAQLTRARQFEALATFASGMAHELATPLGTIAVVSTEMDHKARSLCRNATCGQDVRLIRNEVERCQEILQRLRQTDAQDQQLPPESIDLLNLPREVPARLAADHANRLQWKFEEDLPHPVLPRLGLMQALSILIKNACEADPDDNPVTVCVCQKDGDLSLSVLDKGQGMDPETLEKIGDPFFTTKQPGFGTGLGLFLVRTFLDQAGGELKVESKPDQGSTFEMKVPLA